MIGAHFPASQNDILHVVEFRNISKRRRYFFLEHNFQFNLFPDYKKINETIIDFSKILHDFINFPSSTSNGKVFWGKLNLLLVQVLVPGERTKSKGSWTIINKILSFCEINYQEMEKLLFLLILILPCFSTQDDTNLTKYYSKVENISNNSEECFQVVFNFTGEFHINISDQSGEKMYQTFRINRNSINLKKNKSVSYNQTIEAGTKQICFTVSQTPSTVNMTFYIKYYTQKLKYEVYEDLDYLNCVLIKITLENLFKYHYKNDTKFISSISIFIDQQAINMTQVQTILQDQIILIIQFKQSTNISSLELNITKIIKKDNTPINFTYIRQGNLEFLNVYSEETTEMLYNIQEVFQYTINGFKISSQSLHIIGSVYLIFNFFTFTHLILLFSYIDIKSTSNLYKKFMNKILKIYFKSSDVGFLTSEVFGITVNNPDFQQIEEKISPTKSQLEGMAENGFSSIFLKNSWDQFVFIGWMIIKLAIIRLVAYIPSNFLQKKCQKIRKMELISILYEILANSPTIVIPLGCLLGARAERGSINFPTKLNLILYVGFGFILFFAPFLIFVKELSRKKNKPLKKKKINLQKEAPNKEKSKQNQQKKTFKKFDTSRSQKAPLQGKSQPKTAKKLFQKAKKTKAKESEKRRKKLSKSRKKHRISQLELVNNSMLFFIPFLVGLGYTELFIFSVFLFIVFRLVFFIKSRAYCGKWTFFKEFLNRGMWILFIIVYLFYWRIENKNNNNEDKEKQFQVLANLGLVSIFIIIIGGAFEFLFLIIDFFIWFLNFLKKLSKQNKNRVQPLPENNNSKEKCKKNGNQKQLKEERSAWRIEEMTDPTNRKKLKNQVIQNLGKNSKASQVDDMFFRIREMIRRDRQRNMGDTDYK